MRIFKNAALILFALLSAAPGAVFGMAAADVPAETAASAQAADAAGETVQESKRQAAAVIIRIDDMIGGGLESYLARALKEGEQAGAETAVIVINTFGGTLEAAIQMGGEIRNSPLHTVAYVEGKAISAGTYLALSADEIYMQEGSMIGSAAIVDAAGERVRDSKTVEAWVQLMRGAAERNGRNPDIAHGMADDTVTVEMPELNKTSPPGHLIALTARDALAVGYAEGVVDSLRELLDILGIGETIEIEPRFAERAAAFLTRPIVQIVLLIIGIGGILIELITPGLGVPGIAGALAFGLYFFGNYAAGFAGAEHIAMFIVGVLLLIIEIFTPTFGILGVLGIISLIAGVLLAAQDTGEAAKSLGIAFLIAIVIVAIFARIFKHLGVWNKFVLKDAMRTEEGYVSHVEKTDLTGKRGTALTPLRPSGTALIEDKRVDVVTEGEFIPKGTPVVVILAEGGRVVVRAADETSE